MAKKKYDFSFWDKTLTLNENAQKLNIDKNYCRVYAHRNNLSFKRVYKVK